MDFHQVPSYVRGFESWQMQFAGWQCEYVDMSRWVWDFDRRKKEEGGQDEEEQEEEEEEEVAGAGEQRKDEKESIKPSEANTHAVSSGGVRIYDALLFGSKMVWGTRSLVGD